MAIQTKEIKHSTIMWTRQSTLKAFQNKRELTSEEIKNGARKLFSIKGDGTIMDVRDGSGQFVMSADGSGEILRKKIFNTDYLSPSGFKNPVAQEYLKKGIVAERENRKQDAADYFNAFLNAVTLSFSVLSNSKFFNGTIANGDQISGNLQAVEGKNGILVTIDPKTITVKEVKANSMTTINPFELVEDETSVEEILAGSKPISSNDVEDFMQISKLEHATS